MGRHIGIVAISPEGSALCYRRLGQLATQIEDPAKRPSITLHNLPFRTYLEAIHRNDWEAVGTMLRWSAETLAAVGADFLILPDNVAHQAIHYAEPGSRTPWLNMVDLVADRVAHDKHHTIGIIGTRMMMNGSVYQTVLGMRGVTLLTPSDDDVDAIDRIIFNELVEGRVEDDSRNRVMGAIQSLVDRGCEGLILGSTEAPLLVRDAQTPLPVYDPVEVLVQAAVERATA